MRAIAILATGLSFIIASPLPAQGPDEAAVREVLDRVFTGMAEADSAGIRSALAEGARFALVASPDEASTIRYSSPDGWLAAVADSQNRWEERIYDVAIRVDDTMASAWTPYVFLLDGAVRHCGVNSIELLKARDGWKITQLSDTRRTEGCPEPPGDAPAPQGHPVG